MSGARRSRLASWLGGAALLRRSARPRGQGRAGERRGRGDDVSEFVGEQDARSALERELGYRQAVKRPEIQGWVAAARRAGAIEAATTSTPMRSTTRSSAGSRCSRPAVPGRLRRAAVGHPSATRRRRRSKNGGVSAGEALWTRPSCGRGCGSSGAFVEAGDQKVGEACGHDRPARSWKAMVDGGFGSWSAGRHGVAPLRTSAWTRAQSVKSPTEAVWPQ